MAIDSEIVNTAERLQAASRSIAKVWDGRASILAMKNADYPHWRQMEWIGFYFQYLCENTFAQILEMPGKRYGRTEFDAFGNISWDFKSHAFNSTRNAVIANDTEAILQTMDEYGYYGLILAIGEVEYNDEELTFKRWHDELKGAMSAYEVRRIARGAMSRIRKTEFTLSEICFVCLDEDGLKQCYGTFQQGFRNSDGRPRRQKVTINLNRIPDNAVLGIEKF